MDSHLVDTLAKHSADVHLFVRATSTGELNNTLHRCDAIIVLHGDFRDNHFVERVLKTFMDRSETLIFQLVAQVQVGESRA
ncbi:hypothetical protein ACKVMT_13335 [Halobacteriales archaeon Cl-PHB]